ncbi:hypothetical protein MSAN_01242400 [Mycena sanguinolenta]|uniref:Uncharacterized protein n=1 Tax=Mycena sanguinolenta TaxID=230812 RepID=A0A8H6YI75_9AGAR|nr:hypothetical protein MSAN_01242400 [Mycena sanguinolenta]
MIFSLLCSSTRCWLNEPRVQPRCIRHAIRRSLNSIGSNGRSVESGKSTRRTPVSTLDPARLKPSDHLDISSLLRYTIRVQSTYDHGTPAYPTLSYYKHKGVPSAFPPRTAGYFYFYRPQNLPCTAGAIRFRIASVYPAKFSRGRDLLRPDGVPWEVSLPMVAKTRPVLRDLLLRDGLVTATELRECQDMFHSHRKMGRVQTLLYRFDQPFSVSFDGSNHIQIVIGAQKYSSRIAVFQEQRSGWSCPYSGKALVRFELSPLPEHANSRRIVLRVIKITDPPKLRIPYYDGYLPRPNEGELVYRPRQGPGSKVGPWSRSLDSQVGEPLRLLLDAKELANAE